VWLSTGCGLNIEFIDHLRTQLELSNYSAIANLHTVPITTNNFPACCVFNSRSLVTGSNRGDSSASALKFCLNGGSLPTDSLLHSLPHRTDLVAPIVFLITPRHGPITQHLHSHRLTVSAGMSLPKCSLAVAVYSCLLRICCLATDVVPLSVSRPSPGNECYSRAVRCQRLFFLLHSSCFEQIYHNMYIYLFMNTYPSYSIPTCRWRQYLPPKYRTHFAPPRSTKMQEMNSTSTYVDSSFLFQWLINTKMDLHITSNK
jgi:hypothetical protein